MNFDQCPHCGVHKVATDRLAMGESDKGTAYRWVIHACNNCGKLVLVGYKCKEANPNELDFLFPSGHYDLDADAPIDQHIRDDFNEAGKCLDAGCAKASMVMSRRAIQRVLKEQGCNQNRLVDAINHAINHSILRPSFHGVATEIREYGNLGAHPDDGQLQNATVEHARILLGFVRLLVHEFYEVPAQVDSLKAKRQAAKP